ncbi:hypothetical protein [Nocardia shimofusensis]|uniref:hypothetical protein n=1 Tax=Nocardia shimofusensis TaxID=228596 RepID=UPI0008305D50|nr:hypothetical protein [Nocardia shimofusensis]
MKLLNPHRIGLACSALAVLAGTVVACGEQVPGTALPNTGEVAIYQSEQAAATSSRRAAEQAQAITDNCAPFANTSGIGVQRYNEFVEAHDSNAPDYDARRDTAATTLQDAANKVEAGVNNAGDKLPPDLAGKLIEYVNAARQLAEETGKMSYHANVDPLNAASQRVNNARNTVREACP